MRESTGTAFECTFDFCVCAPYLETMRCGALDRDAEIRIVRRALEEPMRQIVADAGKESSIVPGNVSAGDGTFGYNAATSECADIMAIGVLDPTKDTRLGLQNAASISSLVFSRWIASSSKRRSTGGRVRRDCR